MEANTFRISSQTVSLPALLKYNVYVVSFSAELYSDFLE